jgi:Holliday junction resolvasome RuvABC ATP-dependent DNA helicase subunit
MRELCSNLNPFTLIGATTRSGLLTALCELVLVFLLDYNIYRGTIDYLLRKVHRYSKCQYRWKLLSKLQVEVGTYRMLCYVAYVILHK